METELRDQGKALSRRAAAGAVAASRAAELLADANCEYVLIAARGSSDNAARYAQYLLGTTAGMSVALAAPWLYGHGHDPPRLDGAVVIGISQSGRSPDVVSVLAAARAQGRPTIAITNDPGSGLAARADVVVELGVGTERAVAATKTYLASLHALAQIASELRPDRVSGSDLEALPELVSGFAAEQLAGRGRYDRLASRSLLTVVGRGMDLSTAFETALKLREMSGIPAEAFSPPDLIHGPIAALGSETALWVVRSSPDDDPEDVAALAQISASSGWVVAVSGQTPVLELADLAIALPTGLAEWAGPVAAVIPGQVAALRLAELRGVDVDSPNGLRKVTLTT